MRKRIEKIVCMSMAAIMMMSLVACGNSKENNTNANRENGTTQSTTQTETEEEKKKDETIVLTVLTDRSDLMNTKLQEYKATFESNHENVEVQYVPITNYEKGAMEYIEQNDYGDVMLIPDSVTNEQLVDLYEPLGTVEELSETYKEGYLQDRQVEGVVYGIPRYGNVHGLLYNKEVFEDAGIIELPKTPEEFLEALKKIQKTQPDVIPFYTNFRDADTMAQWQSHVWGSVSCDADYRNNGITFQTHPFTEDKPAYQVYQLLYDIVKMGYSEDPMIQGNSYTIAQKMNNGQIACMMADISMLRKVQLAGVNPDDIGYMPFPYSKNEEQYVTIDLDYSYAVNKNSENKELAKEWITYMLLKSGYAESENRVLTRNKAALPDSLENFRGTHFVLSTEAEGPSVGRYDKLVELSGLDLEKGNLQMRLVKAALIELAASDTEDELEVEALEELEVVEESQERDTFESIMAEWDERWANAQHGKAADTTTEK